MDINSLLCSGRENVVNICSKNKTQTVRVFEPARHVSTDLKLSLQEPRILPVTPTRKSRRELSPTKSILRSKSPSERHESPSSYRNVRFSDKQCGINARDISPVFKNPKVNEHIQTDSKCHDKETGVQRLTPIFTELSTASPRKGFPTEPVSNRQKPLPYQTRTSTPRNNTQEIPAVDFEHFNRSRSLSPEHEENRPLTKDNKDQKKCTNCQHHVCCSEKKSFSSNGRHKSLDCKSRETLSTRSKITPDGSQIIKNMEFGRQNDEPEITGKPLATETQTDFEEIPDGNRIIRNLSLNNTDSFITTQEIRITSISTQTCEDEVTDENDCKSFSSMSPSNSLRSLSPVQSKIGVPYGKSGAVNLNRFEHNKGYKSLSTQTNDSDNESIRSISPDCEVLQSMDESTQCDTDRLKCASTAAQTDMAIFDNRIMQRMDMSMEDENLHGTRDASTSPRYADKSTKTTEVVHPLDSVLSVTESYYDNNSTLSKSVTVQTNMDTSEVSPETSEIKEPHTRSAAVQAPEMDIDTPDGNSIIKNMTPKHEDAKQLHENKAYHSKWKKFIEDIDKSMSRSGQCTDLVESIHTNCKDEKHISVKETKVKLVPCERLSEHSARSLLSGDSLRKHQHQQIMHNEFIKAKTKSASQSPTRCSPVSFDHSRLSFRVKIGQDDTAFHSASLESKNNFGTNSYSYNTKTRQPENEKMHKKMNMSRQKLSSSLGFTPIETYSFKPETLLRKVSSMHERQKKKANFKAMSEDQKTREGHSKNLFIQGLDLGPAPIAKSSLGHFSPGRRFSNLERSESMSQPLVSTTYCKPYRSHSSSYLRPLHANLASSDFDLRPGRHDNWHCRSLSAPPARHSSFILTPALSQMRNNAARKHISNTASTKHQERKRKPLSPQSSRRNGQSPARVSRYDSFRYGQTSNEDALLKRWAISPPRTSSDYKLQLSLNTLVPSKQRYSLAESAKHMYIDALNDQCNRRQSPPKSSSNSEHFCSSIRRSPSPRRHLDSSLEADREVKTYVVDCSSDEDTYVTLETSRRSSRSPPPRRKITRKPPLPKEARGKLHKPTKPEISVDTSKSTQIIGRTPIKVSDRWETEQTTCNIVNSHCIRNPPKLTAVESTPESNLETITIGSVPTGTKEEMCLYLGHDKIQKIIEGAKL